MNQLINPKIAAEVLRKLADRIETEEIEIINITHNDWSKHLNKENFSIEWRYAGK